MEKIIDAINDLHLESLHEDWVHSIYFSEFLEISELPLEYDEIEDTIDVCSLLRKIIKSFDNWLSTDNLSSEEKSWALLSKNVEHRKLLAVIAHYIDNGTKNVLTKTTRSNAFLASRLYYKLLSIPGYKAYHIYHSQLFVLTLSCLTFPKLMCESDTNYFNSKELTHEVNSVLRELKKFIPDLKSIILDLQLNPNDMNFEDILSHLVDITGGGNINKLHVDKIYLNYINGGIYEIIDMLICESDGQINEEAIKLLFKCLHPKLISASVDSRSSNNLVRASYVSYLGLLLNKYGKSAISAYIILLQHLCYTLDGLERSEVRTARVSLVIGLMSLLPPKSYQRIIKWLLKLSTTSKVSHRQVALELLCKLLSSDSEDSSQDCTRMDTSENGHNTEENNAAAKELEGLSPRQTIGTEENQRLSEHNNTTNDDVNEDVEDLLRQRLHRVPHAEILHAVHERVHDVSSTVRARALTILTESINSERAAIRKAVMELNEKGDDSHLMSLATRCVNDERAAVRRAAAGFVHALLQNIVQVTSAHLLILVRLCRDASILVRSMAINALGNLTILHTIDPVFDAFLLGPMHQLSDPETKVQEQVITFVKEMLLDRLKKYDANVNEDSVPWMFLSGVTRHNMRRHLQKCCILLAKNSQSVNHRIVDVLSTHLGAVNYERDLHCLVMLTSISRHVEYSDIGFVLNYYQKLVENTKDSDARLLSLTLELLETWQRWASNEERSILRQNLVDRLTAGDDAGCRTACAHLAAQLDPNNIQWATDLMQTSERRALAGGKVDEWVRACDLSLVAPEQPSSELLQLFFSALAKPPPDWNESVHGSAVAGAGRLCVRSREAAVMLAPRFAELLHDSTVPYAPRLNALLALTDICARYTCIVEPLLPAVCACVSAAAPPQLRRAAARSLTRLLLAGYLRLRTPLYYQYCALLADDDEDVREPAEYYLTCCLDTDVIFHHFIDLILHYNKENTEELSFDSRQLIYDVMLQRLSLVQRLNMQRRMANELIASAADMDGELPPEMHAALMDAIALLCGPRMKLPKKPQNTGDIADIDDLQERVTTNIISHKMKRTVAEDLVPAVLQLYDKIRCSGGQLLAYLVRMATDLLADYRQEIEELIDNDEELVERIVQFQQTIGLETTFGNSRNLVTASAPAAPDTDSPRARRPRPSPRTAPRKRTLRM